MNRGSLYDLILRREWIPDPRGTVGFFLVSGVLCAHLTLTPGPHGSIWSENQTLDAMAHWILFLGPPASLFLGVRSLVVAKDSLLPLVSVPVALLLTTVTLGSWVIFRVIG